MKLIMNEMLKIAGLPLREKDDASSEHKKNERQLFADCCACAKQVMAMCEARLKEKDLSPEHKKQYTEMCDCATKCCDMMQKHLDSYKE